MKCVVSVDTPQGRVRKELELEDKAHQGVVVVVHNQPWLQVGVYDARLEGEAGYLSVIERTESARYSKPPLQEPAVFGVSLRCNVIFAVQDLPF